MPEGRARQKRPRQKPIKRKASGPGGRRRKKRRVAADDTESDVDGALD